MRKFEAQIVIPNKEEKKVIDKIISDIEKENKISKKRDKERENFIQSFKSFSIGEMGYILERLNQIYCNVKIEEMSKELPDTDISEEQVMKEVSRVRYGAKKKR